MEMEWYWIVYLTGAVLVFIGTAYKSGKTGRPVNPPALVFILLVWPLGLLWSFVAVLGEGRRYR